VDDAPQFLGQHDAGVSRSERRQLCEAFGDLAGAGKELVGSDNLIDGAPFLGRLGIELLAGEDEIAAAYRADRFLPQEMDAITRHDAEVEVRLVLKNRRWSCQHDVGEQDILGVQPRRAVDRGDQRRFDVEDVHKDFSALAINLVVALRCKEVETLGADGLHERAAATGQYDDTVIRVRPDRMKQVDKLFVSMTIEDERTAPRVKRYFEHA
jgi:hypothetical protein